MDKLIADAAEWGAEQAPCEDAGEAQMANRKPLAFAEIAKLLAEKGVSCEKDAWQLAKAQLDSGDPRLFNQLGAQNVHEFVAKALGAWNCHEMSRGTSVSVPDFPLSSFISIPDIDPQIDQWLANWTRKKVLILKGPPGWGKTEFASALLCERVCGKFGHHFLNRLDQLKKVRFLPEQGLLIDELYLGETAVDVVKALLDLAKPRAIHCRNDDGHVPRGTPRVFTTNWSWEMFWPQEVFHKDHKSAILRRIVWVDVARDLRKNPPPPENHVPAPAVDSGHPDERDRQAQEAEYDDYDVFGFDEP